MSIQGYQAYRKEIQSQESYESMKRMIEDKTYGPLSSHQILGLLREWRAFWYLVSRYPKWDFRITDAGLDRKGIDIAALLPNGKFKTFQVGGNWFEGKKVVTTYFLQVTDKKIYLRKGKEDANEIRR